MRILVFTFLLFTTLAITNRPFIHLKNTHNFNEQLCKKKSGIVCGFVQKDCCLTGCKSFLGLNEVCSDGKQIDLNALSCDKICQSKGGELYTEQILTVPKCCRKGYYKNDKCIQGNQIELGECQSPTLTDKIVGLVEKS